MEPAVRRAEHLSSRPNPDPNPPSPDPKRPNPDPKRSEAAREPWNAVGRHWILRNPDRLWRRHSDTVNSHLLSEWLPSAPVERLLKTDLFDEAVADGVYRVLATRARKVYAIDVSRDIVRATGGRYPEIRGVEADVRELPFASGSFGSVVSISTLDHFRSWRDLVEALAEIRRILEPDGGLILTMDNGANPVIALRNALPFALVRRLGLVPYPVGKTAGPGRLRRLLREQGFQVEECRAVLHCPRVLAVVVARLVQRYGRERVCAAFLLALARFEGLARWPTRFLSGHFVAVRGRKAGGLAEAHRGAAGRPAGWRR